MGICTALLKMVGQGQNVVKILHSAGFYTYNSDPSQYFVISISIELQHTHGINKEVAISPHCSDGALFRETGGSLVSKLSQRL